MNNDLIILGGMGPQASLRLHELLLSRSLVLHDGAPDTYPSILHASLQIPDFVSTADNIPVALSRLRSACAALPLKDAKAIGIPCNTAHMLVGDLPLAHVNFVSMTESVISEIKRQNIKRVGLLASPHTIRTGLYSGLFTGAEISTLTPSSGDTEELGQIILEVINQGDINDLRMRLSLIADSLIGRGAQAILLGCTELPLVGIDAPRGIKVIDSLEVLADAMLQKLARTV